MIKHDQYHELIATDEQTKNMSFNEYKNFFYRFLCPKQIASQKHVHAAPYRAVYLLPKCC